MSKAPKDTAEAEPVEQIAEGAPDITAPVTPAPKSAHEIAQEKEAARLAKLEADKKAFVERVMEARKPEEKPVVAQPVAPAILKQTQLEMAAGARMNKHFEQFHAAHPQPTGHVPAPGEKTTSVFRPADYVPDQKKGQGYVEARPVTRS